MLLNSGSASSLKCFFRKKYENRGRLRMMNSLNRNELKGMLLASSIFLKYPKVARQVGKKNWI